MKKQLLFIIDSLNCGGAEKSLVSLLPLLDYEQYDVDLMLFDRGGIFETYVPDRVKVIDYRYQILYPYTIKGQIRKFICFSLLSPQLRCIKKMHGAEVHWRTMRHIYKTYPKEYDVAVAYQQGVPTFFLAEKVKAKKKIAWINANIFADKYNMEFCRPYYEKMDYIIAVSEQLYGIVCDNMSWAKEKVRTIYDCIYPKQIYSLAKELVHDLIKREVTLVTVGRLSEQKNHYLAVDAAKVLKEKGLDFIWYFIGEGELRSRIKTKIDDLGLDENVKMLGMKQNPYPYINQADIYVQTSSFEGFCLTLAEARILHRPIVSTNFDVVYDQIVDYQNGLIAEMNPNSVAEKILELVNNESLRETIVKNLEKETNTTSSTEIQKFYSMLNE